MATLTGTKIKDTYQGLIKTTDNAALPLSGKVQITDGEGNASVLELGQQEAAITNATLYSGAATIASDPLNDQFVYAGTQDFSGATVVGISGGAGLVAGAGADSMVSAASLTTTPAQAGADSVALGDNARAEDARGVALGINSWAQSGDCLAIGNGAHARLSDCISIGTSSQAADVRGIAIGKDSQTNTSILDAIAIGTSATSSASGAIALGANITASKVDTLSVKALETQTPSTPTAGGIVMKDAGSTERRINIDASGALLIDSTPVGGGGGGDVFNATRTTYSGPSTGDEIITSITIPANTFGAGDILKAWAMYTFDFTGGGTNYFAAQISNSPDFNTGNYFQLGAGSTATDAGWILNKSIVINTADGTGLGTSTAAVDSMQDIDGLNGYFQYGDNLQKAIDWTSTVYLHYTGYVDNASSSTTIVAGYVKKEN